MVSNRKTAPAAVTSPFREGFATEVNEVMQRLLPDQDTSSIPLFASATTAAKLLENFNQRNLKSFGFNYTEYLVLALLRASAHSSSGLSPSTLNQTLMLTTGGLTQIIQRLEKSRLLMKSPNPSDGRSVVLVLTPEGEAMADKMLVAQAEAQRQRLAWLSAEQREQLATSLQILLKVLAP